MAIILDGSSGISVLGSNVLTASIVGSTVQAYDANTAKYDDTTSNFTGILQKSGSNVLTTSSLDVSNVLFASNIGSTVQAWDSDLDTWATKTAPSGTVVGTTDTQNLTNKTITTIKETITISATAATGTVNFNAITQSVLYYTTNSSGNWTLNVIGDESTTLNSIISIGQSITVAFLATNTTAYYQNGFQIDGNSVIPKWQNGTAPSSGNANSVDIYNITIVKTANATYTVFASQTKFA